MSKVDLITKINKTIVHEDGSIDSFDRQLLLYKAGNYTKLYPLVVCDNSSSINFLLNEEEKKMDLPILINTSTIDKFTIKHPESLLILADVEKLMKNSFLAFDSIQFNTSKMIVLDAKDKDDFQMVCICRLDKVIGSKGLMVHEITSIYEKKALIHLMNKSFELGGKFYKNKKTEHFANRFSTQLSKPLAYALSNSYSKQSFTKSQVMEDLVCDPIIIDENEEYRLFQCSEYVFEVRDMDDTFITYTYSDNLEGALDELQNQNELSI